MTNDDIAQRRLHGLALRGAPAGRPADVVRRLGAMQAQEFAYARWAVGQRCGSDAAAVDAAFAAGEILRTHALRPTWHFIAREDIRWVLAATAPRVRRMAGYHDRQLGLDAAVLRRSRRLIARALEVEPHLTRAQLGAALDAGGVPARGQRLGHILMHAELDALVCSGPLAGRQHTYGLVDDRAPGARVMPADEALDTLTRRYFATRGPATLRDYMAWASLTAATARRGLAMVASDLEQSVIGGRTYWSALGTPPPPRSRRPTVDLVQCYDEYVMSYTESRDILLSPGTTAIAPPARESIYSHAILLDGHLAGHWRHALEASRVVVDVYLYRALSPTAERALEAAVNAYGRFNGKPAVLRR